MQVILNHDISWLVKANFYKLEPAINQHTYEKVFIVKTRFRKFVQFLKIICVRQFVVIQYHRSSEFLWFCFVIRGVQLAALCLLNLGQLEQEPKNRASIYVLLDMVSTLYIVIFFLVSVGRPCSPVMSERVLQSGRPLFRSICTSSVQCRHWSRHMVKTSFILQKGTAWCSEIGSLTSLDACNSGASSDRGGPISLHQAVFAKLFCRSCEREKKRGWSAAGLLEVNWITSVFLCCRLHSCICQSLCAWTGSSSRQKIFFERANRLF